MVAEAAAQQEAVTKALAHKPDIVLMDIRLAGGVAAIRQYLQAGLIDQLHLAIAPILLGSGESLFSGIDTLKLGYVLTEHVQTAKATHIVTISPVSSLRGRHRPRSRATRTGC